MDISTLESPSFLSRGLEMNPSYLNVDHSCCSQLSSSSGLSSPKRISSANKRRRSSCESSGKKGENSPRIMESCMFNFPVPTPRMWTILVEPVTKQAAAQPHLISWKPENVVVSDKSSSSSSSLSSSSSQIISLKGSPNLDLLNSQLINDRGSNSSEKVTLTESSIKSHRNPDQDIKKRVFTFVSDKRMAVDDGIIMPEVPTLSREPTPEYRINDYFSSITYDVRESKKSSLNGRSRKLGRKKPLTFHQLDFNRETLKPFDRSVFVIGNVPCKELDSEKKPSKKMLMEAAEILIGLQSDQAAEHNSLDTSSSCSNELDTSPPPPSSSPSP